MILTLLAIILVLALGAPLASASATATLTVSAAASLGDALHAVTNAFEAKHRGVRVELNLGSSGALRQQIERGAPVDVFLSAAEEPVQALIERGLVRADEVWTFAGNRLVLVRSGYAPPVMQGWEDLLHPDLRRIAIGNPEHVPAGQYGKAVLEHLGLWEPLGDKLVFGEDVRQILAYVESGAADAGIVYSTDAAAAKRVHVVARAPAGSHAPIRYPAALVRTSRFPGEARAFIDFLLSEEGQAILAAHGFGGPEER